MLPSFHPRMPALQVRGGAYPSSDVGFLFLEESVDEPVDPSASDERVDSGVIDERRGVEEVIAVVARPGSGAFDVGDTGFVVSR